MRCLVLAAVVATAAVPAIAADWVKLTEKSYSTLYMDVTSIKSHGSLRRVWFVDDFRTPYPDGTRSIRTLSEFDCDEERMRDLQKESMSGQMATGRAIDSDPTLPDVKWLYIAPRSNGEKLLKALCSRRDGSERESAT